MDGSGLCTSGRSGCSSGVGCSPPIGDGLVPVATTFAVLDIGTPTDLGYVFAAFMGARVLSVVAGGVWADRLPRQA